MQGSLDKTDTSRKKHLRVNTKGRDRGKSEGPSFGTPESEKTTKKRTQGEILETQRSILDKKGKAMDAVSISGKEEKKKTDRVPALDTQRNKKKLNYRQERSKN